jgi:outer membrane protein assembly factor BamB
VISDTTSSQFTQYTPDQVGTYKFSFSFPGQTYTWSGAYQNDTFLPSTSNTETVTVQQTALPSPINSYPMPTEYWTRPIEGQNTYWYTLASNWLGSGSPQIIYRLQPDGIAPNSAHIMWTKPLQDGGVIGGGNQAIPGNMYYEGLDYNYRFNNPIIMYGRLYYQAPLGNAGTGGPVMCVDLRTGETLWSRTDIPAPTFGYLYSYEMMNQHGAVPDGFLFTDSFARAFDPGTGTPMFNVTSVPSGTAWLGPSGEILRYAVTNAGTTANPQYYLTQWNSSNVFNVQTSGSIAGNVSTAYDYNVSIPWYPTGGTIINAYTDDLILGRNGTTQTLGTWAPFTMWAMSLKPETRGKLLWMVSINAPPQNQTLFLGPVDPVNRVWTIAWKETMCFLGYSLETGKLLWGPTPTEAPLQYYDFQLSATGFPRVAYGILYDCGWSGLCYAYNVTTGKLLWTYGNGGPGNNTDSYFQIPFGKYPIFITAIADGKLYTYYSEHSPNTPLFKNAQIRCLDAYTGKEIWTVMGYGGSQGNAGGQMGAVTAEGFYVYFNAYDSQIYSFGRGPSATTVSIQNNVINQGENVLITGTVIDTATGTKENEQAARFPTGVPAVSDASMSAWMEYVYMQKPKPMNTVGVTVTLTATDPNGNYQKIGAVTSDAAGNYALLWKPPVPGLYSITASFNGTNAYWPSEAETHFGVEAATSAAPIATSAPTPTQNVNPTQQPTQTTSPSPSANVLPPTSAAPTATYLTIGTAVIVIVIAAAALLIRRRK